MALGAARKRQRDQPFDDEEFKPLPLGRLERKCRSGKGPVQSTTSSKESSTNNSVSIVGPSSHCQNNRILDEEFLDSLADMVVLTDNTDTEPDITKGRKKRRYSSTDCSTMSESNPCIDNSKVVQDSMIAPTTTTHVADSFTSHPYFFPTSNHPDQSVLLHSQSTPEIEACLHGLRVWNTLAEESIRCGVCIDHIQTLKVIRNFESLISSILKNQSISFVDFIQIEQHVLINTIPTLESFLTLSAALNLTSLMSVTTTDMKKPSINKEIQSQFRCAITTILNTSAAIELFALICSVPGTLVLAECMTSETLMHKMISFLLSQSLKLLSKASQLFAASSKSAKLGKNNKRKRIDANIVDDGEKIENADEKTILPNWTSLQINTMSQIIHHLLSVFLSNQFPDTSHFLFISFLVDCLISHLPNSTLLHSLNLAAVNAIVVIFARFPQLRGTINSLLMKLIPYQLIKFSPTKSIHPFSYQGRLSINEGLSLHPLTLTFLRMSMVFSLCDGSATSFSLKCLRQRHQLTIAFIRQVSQRFVQSCLLSFKDLSSSGKKGGTLSGELKKSRDVLMALLVDFCEASTSPLFPTAFIFLQQICRQLIKLAMTTEEHPLKKHSNVVWITESALFLLSEVSRHLFLNHFEALKSNKKSQVIDKQNDQNLNVCNFCLLPTSAVSHTGLPLKEFPEFINQILTCNDCHRNFHSSCVDVEGSSSVTSSWLCESCLLKRTALQLFMSNSRPHMDVWLNKTSPHYFLLESDVLECLSKEMIHIILFLDHISFITNRKFAVPLFTTTKSFVVDENRQTNRNGVSDTTKTQQQRILLPIEPLWSSDHPGLSSSSLLALFCSEYFFDGAQDNNSLPTPNPPPSSQSLSTTATSYSSDKTIELPPSDSKEIPSNLSDSVIVEIESSAVTQMDFLRSFLMSEWVRLRPSRHQRHGVMTSDHSKNNTGSPSLHQHALHKLWNQQICASLASTRSLLLNLFLSVVMESPHASCRRASIQALGICLSHCPSLIDGEKPAMIRGLLSGLKDTAPRVREKAVAVVESCYRKVEEVVGNHKTLGLLIKELANESLTHEKNLGTKSDVDLKNLILKVSGHSSDQPTELQVSAFGDIGCRSPNTTEEENVARVSFELLNSCRLLDVMMCFALPHIARTTADISLAVRIRSVKFLGQLLKSLPTNSPLLCLLATKLLQRLQIAHEAPTIQLEAISVFNSIWFSDKFIKEIESDHPIEFDVVLEASSSSSSSPGSSVLPSIADRMIQNDNDRTFQCDKLDIFVKTLIIFSTADQTMAEGTSRTTLEDIIRALSQKSMKTEKSLIGSNDETLSSDLTLKGPLKAALDSNLSPLRQVIVIGVVTHCYTLKEIDKTLSTIAFQLLTLFLQREKCKSDNFTASALEIIKVIRLLIASRPVALADSFVKHLFPYLLETPKTQMDSDLVVELLYIIFLALNRERSQVSMPVKKELKDLEISLTQHIIPCGRPTLVEPAIRALCASVMFTTQTYQLIIEPLFTDALAILLPVRDILIEFQNGFEEKALSNCSISHLRRAAAIEVVKFALSLLTRHKLQNTLPSKQPAESHIRTILEKFKGKSNSMHAVVTIDLSNMTLLKKQLQFICEGIKRRVFRLSCLCRSLDLNSNVNYDLDDNNAGAQLLKVEQNKDVWDFKTPEPRARRTSFQTVSLTTTDHSSSDKVSSNVSKIDDTTKPISTPPRSPSKSLVENLNEDSIVIQMATVVDVMALKSDPQKIAMSRLVQTILPFLTEAFYQLHFSMNSFDHLKNSAISDRDFFQPTNSLPINLAKDAYHRIANKVPFDLDKLANNLSHEVFNSIMSLYDTIDILLWLLNNNQMEDEVWLTDLVWNMKAFFIQAIGIFVQKERQFVKSRRFRATFCSALQNWDVWRVQMSTLQSISNLLDQFETDALLEGNRITDTSVGESAQPLSVYGKDVADIARGYIIVDDSSDEAIRTDQLTDVLLCPNKRESIESNVSKASDKSKFVDRITIRSLSLTVLGQLTRQGLINPTSVVDTLFSLLFNPSKAFRDQSLNVLHNVIQMLNEDILIVNRLGPLINMTMLSHFAHLLPKYSALPVSSICCSRCGCPDPMSISEETQKSFLTFLMFYRDVIQRKKTSHEKFTYSLFSILKKGLDVSIRKLIGPFVILKDCQCTANVWLPTLQKLNLSDLIMKKLLLSLTFQKWMIELILSLPYKTESEILSINHYLATSLLSETAFFTSPVPTEVQSGTQNSQSSTEDTKSVETESEYKIETSTENMICEGIERGCLCLGLMAIKTSMKQFYNLSDEDCLAYDPSAPIITKDLTIKSSKNCEDEDDDDIQIVKMQLDANFWTTGVDDILGSLSAIFQKMEKITKEEINRILNNVMIPKLSGAFDVKLEGIDKLPKALQKKKKIVRSKKVIKRKTETTDSSSIASLSDSSTSESLDSSRPKGFSLRPRRN